MTKVTRFTKENDLLTDLISEKKIAKVADVDESVFIHRLLPLAVSRYSNIDEELDLRHWEAITGLPPTNPIRVTRSGEMLFIAPPLVLSPEVTFGGESLLTRIKENERAKAAGRPVEDVMDSEKMRPVVKTKDLGPALTTWMYIFKLYGITVLPVDPEDNIPELEHSNELPNNSPKAPPHIEFEDEDEELI